MEIQPNAEEVHGKSFRGIFMAWRSLGFLKRTFGVEFEPAAKREVATGSEDEGMPAGEALRRAVIERAAILDRCELGKFRCSLRIHRRGHCLCHSGRCGARRSGSGRR